MQQLLINVCQISREHHLKSKVREFAFDVRKEKDWRVSRRRIKEFVFGVDAQAKTKRAQKKDESILDVAITHNLGLGVQS